jgi:hypothetical protein
MYQLNLADKNLYATLESDSQILNTEHTTPQWMETHFSETNLAPFVAYDNGVESKQSEEPQQNVQGVDVNEPTTVQQPLAAQPQPTQPTQPAQPTVQSQKPVQHKPKRSVWGFIKFALIVILLALIIYFTIYRIGWGVSECAKRNYHDCAALLTPELSALALTSIAL